MRFALGRFALGGAPRSVSALRACRALRSVSALRAWWRFALVALRAQSVRFAHGALRACSPPPPALGPCASHVRPVRLVARPPPPRGGLPPPGGGFAAVSLRLRGASRPGPRLGCPVFSRCGGSIILFFRVRRLLLWCAGSVPRVGPLGVRRLNARGLCWRALSALTSFVGWWPFRFASTASLWGVPPRPCTGLPDAAPLLALPALAAACGGCKPCPALFMPLASLSFPLATA